MHDDVNELTVEDIEKFLSGEGDATSASSDETSNPAESGDNSGKSDVTNTQAFAHRLKEATAKARNEERENVAKELGFASYDEMRKAKEHNLIREKGFDPDEVSPLVDEIVQKRLADDPRMKELDALREQQMQSWAQKEITELTNLTDGRVKSLDDVPKPVIERWKQTGSLKKAYMELEGENLIKYMQTKYRGEGSKGTTAHMNSPAGSPKPVSETAKRPLTDHEKDVYRIFNPDISDDELNAMTKDL